MVQETATEATFTVEIDAVADAPTLQAEESVIDPTAEDYTPPIINITGIEDQKTFEDMVDENDEPMVDENGETVKSLVSGIDLSGKITATADGGDKIGAFLVYLTRPDGDTSYGTLKDYLVGRGLIESDGSPNMQLFDIDNL